MLSNRFGDDDGEVENIIFLASKYNNFHKTL